jgi:ATP-binding cassette subfamily B protein
VKEADQIVVLKDGAIAERGTHTELVALGGIYADLHQKQLLEEELDQL